MTHSYLIFYLFCKHYTTTTAFIGYRKQKKLRYSNGKIENIIDAKFVFTQR